jgi:hypothetical protein
MQEQSKAIQMQEQTKQIELQEQTKQKQIELDIIKESKNINNNNNNNKKRGPEDLYLQFLNECTEKSDTHIATTNLYETFKLWFKNNNPNTKIPSNREFVPNIKKHNITVEIVKIDGKTYYGIKQLKIKDIF